MCWKNLLFLHWRWEPGDMQSRLPGGLEVETFDGSAWLGVVPFLMRRVHPAFLFPVPWLSDFEELNVRTYVRSRDGTRGVWFFSLACNQPVAVELARRCFFLNYVHATMRATERGGLHQYFCQRPMAPRFCIEYPRVEDARLAKAVPGSLEQFLVERYVLFSADRRGRLYSGQVVHEPYEIHDCRPVAGGFQAAVADGFPDPGRPADHALLAADVAVKAMAITRC